MRSLRVLMVTCALVCGALVVAGTPAATGAAARPKWSPGHYTPAAGPKFNDPLGGKTARRTLLRHVIRSIDSVRGYRVRDTSRCPRDPDRFPAEIKISLYSIADMRFVDSLVAAHRRCVSVQVLMNDHLDASTSPSWARLLHALGSNRHARSWAYRCHNSCRGRGVLHSKFYLFSQAGRARDVVMEGSSNMTTNASGVQWNDLLTVPDNPVLYGQYRSVFSEMKWDRPVARAFRVLRTGRFETVFFPQRGTTASHDYAMDILRSIRCQGANGGAGSGGRTVVEINMHAWSGTRGLYLARKVHRLWADGCIVRVLYGFMWHQTYAALVSGTGPRMDVRRTIFPHPGTNVAAIYSHMKVVAVSGHVGDDRSAWVVWNGSDNFTNLGPHGDEVTMRTTGRALYQHYVDHNAFIRRVRSSPVWAIYEEPSGGGRAPDNEARTAMPDGGTPGGPTYPGAVRMQADPD